MRAATTDRRLEAIAGEPVLVVSEPTQGTITGGTLIAVGAHTASVEGNGVLLLHGSVAAGVNQYAYVTGDPPGQWGPVVVTLHGRIGHLWWAAIPGATGTYGLLRHRSQPSFNWLGPGAAAVWPRTLTPAQATRAAHHLAARLA